MKLGAARRLAGRLHQGQLDDVGEPFIDHLARVASATAAAGGSRVQELAAWLYGCASAGAPPRQLARWGVPPAVVTMVEALSRRPYELFDAYLARVLSRPGAPLVLRAAYADRCRPEALARLERGRRDWRLSEYRRILTALGDTAALAGVPVPSDQTLVGMDVPSLIAKLEPDHPDREAAIEALRRSGDRRAIPRLLGLYRRALARDPAWSPRAYPIHRAIAAIAGHPDNLLDPAWIDSLVAMTRDDVAQLREIALGALARTGDPAHQPLLRAALHSDDPADVYAGVQGLDEASARAELARVAELAIHEHVYRESVRRAAASRLLTLDDPRARAAVIASLGLPGGAPAREVAHRYRDDPAVVPDLLGVLRARPAGAPNAAFVLGELRVREAEPDLIAALRNSGRDALLAASCVEALGKLGTSAAVPALVAAAGDARRDLRLLALLALRRIGDSRAEPVAIAAVDDPDPEVRAAAVRLLAACGGASAVGRLAALAEGPHARAALRGLLRIADERAVPTLIQVLETTRDRRTRSLAGRALVRSARRPPPFYLQDWDPRVRRAQAWVLAQLAAPGSVQILTRALRDPDARVRARAAVGLGRIGDSAAAEPLRRALADLSPRVRASAATALGRLAVPDAWTWLTARLTDARAAVRDAVAAAIRRLHRGA